MKVLVIEVSSHLVEDLADCTTHTSVIGFAANKDLIKSLVVDASKAYENKVVRENFTEYDDPDEIAGFRNCFSLYQNYDYELKLGIAVRVGGMYYNEPYQVYDVDYYAILLEEDDLEEEYNRLLKAVNDWARMDDNEYTSSELSSKGYWQAHCELEKFLEDHPEFKEREVK